MVQPDQINMAVFFWFLIKNEMSSVSYCIGIPWTIHFLQGTRDTRPCLTGHSIGFGEYPGPGGDRREEGREPPLPGVYIIHFAPLKNMSF